MKIDGNKQLQVAVEKFLASAPKDSSMFGRRFAVIGFTGSGKTTYSHRLSKITRAPHIELDRLYWKDGWQRPSDREFINQIKIAMKSTNGSGWVIDGNHAECREYIWTHCDTIVWLDYPKRIILWRFLKRFFINWVTRKKLWGTNNRESLVRGILGRKGIIRRLSEDFSDNREDIFNNLKRYTFKQNNSLNDSVKLIRFTKPERAEEWLNYVELIHSLDEIFHG